MSKITKKEARKLFDKDKFEEITEEEWERIKDVGEFCMHCIDGVLYFKPKEQYPKVFENDTRKIEVYEDGIINIIDKNIENDLYFDGTLPKLYEAVELSKKLRGEE